VNKFWPPETPDKNAEMVFFKLFKIILINIQNYRIFLQFDTISNKRRRLSHELAEEHVKCQPRVSMFLLMGMAQSYTDFHVDFGGSSVWYHVLRGQKVRRLLSIYYFINLKKLNILQVFYVLPPTEKNLDAFTKYQQQEQTDGERLFTDIDRSLAAQCVRLVVNAVRTFE